MKSNIPIYSLVYYLCFWEIILIRRRSTSFSHHTKEKNLRVKKSEEDISPTETRGRMKKRGSKLQIFLPACWYSASLLSILIGSWLVFSHGRIFCQVLLGNCYRSLSSRCPIRIIFIYAFIFKFIISWFLMRWKPFMCLVEESWNGDLH